MAPPATVETQAGEPGPAVAAGGKEKKEEVTKVTLRSSDGEVFEVAAAAMRDSETIKNMLDNDCFADLIHVPNVTGRILAKVIEYCKRHTEAKVDGAADDFFVDEPLKAFDAEFVKVDHDTLFDLILVANYLSIKELLDLTCKTLADQMKGKSPEEIRKLFHIVNDYTKEEEEEVRRENSWAFE